MQNELGNMCLCDICGEEISKYAKLQQMRSSAQKWTKYGMCSVVCSADVGVLRKLDESNSVYNSRNEFNNKSLLQIKRFADQDYRSGIRTSQNIEVSKRNLLTTERKIFIGKLLAIISLIIGLFLLYNELVIGALISLVPVLLGIVLCRLGIWEKCQIK